MRGKRICQKKGDRTGGVSRLRLRLLGGNRRGLHDNLTDANDRGIRNFDAHRFIAARLREAIFEADERPGIQGQRAGCGHLNLTGAVMDFDSFTNK